LPSLLPALQEGLGHDDQWIREASILALGAIADGCKAELTPHLPVLHPFLLRQLTAVESTPQLRCIAAWTLARYASWTVEQLEGSNGRGGDPTLVGQVAEAFALRMLDPHKKVQIALCSAMGVFAEAAGSHLTPYLEPIYGIFVQALNKYGTRSRLVLFDTLGIMAENVGSAVGHGSLPGMYIPPLLSLWNSTAIENPFDRTLLPLMECLGSTTVVCGLNYQPWALETFDMAMSTIEACTIIISHEDDLGDIDEEMTDPIICSVDLIDGLVEGLGPNFASLVNGSPRFGPTFPNVLQSIAGHINTGVRMSAFALLGDLARKAPSLIEAGLSDLLSEAVSSIDPTHSAMCNNAVWALGEVCVRCGDNPGPLAPHADNLLLSLIPLLMGDAVDIDGNPMSLCGIKENASTTMGRLAMVNPNFVAPDLGRFLLGWCDGMTKISDPQERHDAFKGFVIALRANPSSIQATGHAVGEVVNAILFTIFSWHLPHLQEDMPDNLNSDSYEFAPFPEAYGELLALLRQLLLDLKTSLGQEWTAIEAQMPKKVMILMKEVYHI
jgi:transportin-1